MDISGDDSTIKNQIDSPDRRKNQYRNFEIKPTDRLRAPEVLADRTAKFHDTGISSLKDSKSGRSIRLSISPRNLAKSIDRSPVNATMPRGTRSMSFRDRELWDRAVTVSKDPKKKGCFQPDQCSAVASDEPLLQLFPAKTARVRALW